VDTKPAYRLVGGSQTVPRAPRERVVVPLILLVLVINDKEDDAGANEVGSGETAPPGQATTVELLSPKQGETVKGTRLVVRLRVNGELTRPGRVIDHAEGLVHLHVVLDDGSWDRPENSSSPLFEPEKSATSHSALANTRLVYRDIPPGPHVLRVELVHNDHDPAQGIAGVGVEFTTVR
jgi:hypothetical protein